MRAAGSRDEQRYVSRRAGEKLLAAAQADLRRRVLLMSQAMKGLTNCLEHLGLTPASAARAHALPAPTKKERGGLESYFDDPPEPSA